MDPDLTIPETPAAPAAPETPAAGDAPATSFEADLAELVGKSSAITVDAPKAGDAPAEPSGDEPPAEPKPEGEEPPADAPDKAAAAPEKPKDSLAKRLALVAAETRKNEVRAHDLGTRETALQAREQALDARETSLKSNVELVQRIRGAASRVEMVRELLGGDDAFQDFYLEATEHFNGAPPRTAAPKAGDKPLSREDVQKMLEEAREQERGRMKTENEQAEARAKAEYCNVTRSILDGAATEFPLCYAAPPSDVAITAISDEIRRTTGRIPDVKTVLKTIEDHRSSRHQKAARKTPAAEKPATPARPAEQTRAAPSGRHTSVPVTTRPQLTFDQELAQVAAKHAT